MTPAKRPAFKWAAGPSVPGLAVLLVGVAAACAPLAGRTQGPPGVAFLTRDGCPNSAALMEQLGLALAAAGLSTDVQLVDVGQLPSDDPRTGYGTPTVLVDGVDLFGAPTPRPKPPT